MAPRTDPLKKSVADAAFAPFYHGVGLHDDQGYEVASRISDTQLMLRFPGPNGPRYFVVKVSESY